MRFDRHVISGCGGVPADKENLAEIKRQGENAMIVVGGVREMFLQSKWRQALPLGLYGAISGEGDAHCI